MNQCDVKLTRISGPRVWSSAAVYRTGTERSCPAILGGGGGVTAEDGVPDMTAISNIDEHLINTNLQVRYNKDKIYVSFINTAGLTWISLC